MISQNKANSILNSLFGPKFIRVGYKEDSTEKYDPYFQNIGKYDYLVPTRETYLGFCSGEPNHADGSVAGAGEPSSDYGYARKRVGGYGVSDGTDRDDRIPDADRKYFSTTAGGGIIKNTTEIQFSTAKYDYPAKMNYWFLSEGKSGYPFLWGKIKDIFHETTDATGPAILDQIDTEKGNRKYKEYIIPHEKIFSISDNEPLIVTWEGKDYDVTAKLVERLGKNEILDSEDTDPYLIKYIYFGNKDFDSELPEGEVILPFAMSYKIQKVQDDNGDGSTLSITQRSEGRLRVYSFDSKDYESDEAYPSHNFGLYGLGITIPAATVPTFYAGQLQASLDVALNG